MRSGVTVSSSARLPLLLRLLALVLAAAVFPACEPLAPLSLLTLREVSPGEVEVGERIELRGVGFPQGKTAQVTFEGTLHRAGMAPQKSFSVRAPGVVTAEGMIEVHYDRHLEALFCGPEGRAAHTTFRGDVTVAFAAKTQGAPPAAASLANVVLDLRPPPGEPARVERARADGAAVLRAIGVSVAAPQGAQRGLTVAEVGDGSAAALAGLSVGDVLSSFDGLVVKGPADLAPPRGAQRARLGVRRSTEANEIVLDVALQGFRAQVSPGAVLMMVCLAAASGLWLVASPSPLLLFVVRRWRARRLATSPHHRLAAILAVPLTVAVPILLRALWGTEPELWIAAVSTLAASVMVHGLLGDGGVRAALSRVLLTTLTLLPATTVILAKAVSTGATRLSEASHVQGGVPWTFAATSSVSAFFMFAAGVLSLALADDTAAGYGRSARVRHMVSDATTAVMASLLVVTMLGGTESPFEAAAGRELIGAAVFLAKAGALTGALLFIRTALPEVSRRTRFVVAAGSLLGATAATWLEPLELRLAPPDGSVIPLLLTALLGIGVARAAVVAWRMRKDPGQQPRLDPFA